MSKPLSPTARASAIWPWLAATLVLLVLPHLASSNSAISILNQMAITVVFALSYNMLLGQAGMLSFGHAVYMGTGGFAAIHVMNGVEDLSLPLPLPVLPLFAGLFSLGVATLIGAFSVRRVGTVFAMISLGIVELVASLSIIVVAFFGYGGASGDRTYGLPVFGIDFARQIEVYYVIVGWTLLAAALMYLFTRTPLGRMANAVRDNPERAEYLGYSAAWVRFYSFCAAGFFAGIAGGLFAVSYEITTAQNLGLQASGTILMVAFLGGVGHFFGPILGAIVFTLLKTVIGLHTELWQLYLGALFLATVMYFPGGLAGLLMMHAPIARAGNLRRLIRPYGRVALPALVALAGTIIAVEMMHFLRYAATDARVVTVFWMPFDARAFWSWGVSAVAILGGLWALRRALPGLVAAWHAANPG